jgi:xylulokinase
VSTRSPPRIPFSDPLPVSSVVVSLPTCHLSLASRPALRPGAGRKHVLDCHFSPVVVFDKHMMTNESLACVIGCDIGTQSTKAVLVGESGELVATSTARYGVDFPAPRWAEQDARTWTDAVAEVVRSLAGQAPGPVRHIGVSAQVDGVVAVDADLAPVHPALIWMDRRAVAECTRAEERVGVDDVYAITGLNSDACHAAPKMAWLLAQLARPPSHLVSPATLVTAWLTGQLAQDHANASSSMLYDVSRRRWSGPMLDAYEIDRALLPQIVDATDEIGPLRKDVAERLGLDTGCRVVAGTGDDHAGAVGAAAVRPGVVVDVTGTAEPIGTTATTPVFDPLRMVEAHAHAVPDVSFIENGGFVSGGSILWIAQLLGIGQDEVLGRAARTAAGAKGLVFVPALSGSMTPRWNSHATGSFTGLTMEHGADELCRAVLEGCVFASRDVIDQLAALGLPAEELRVTGGGARSKAWLQVKADVTGRPVRPVPGDASATGAACLAAVAAGWFSDVVTAAESLVETSAPMVEPDTSTASAYQSGYDRYRQVYDALEPTFVPS